MTIKHKVMRKQRGKDQRNLPLTGAEKKRMVRLFSY